MGWKPMSKLLVQHENTLCENTNRMVEERRIFHRKGNARNLFDGGKSNYENTKSLFEQKLGK